jgi:hypothetical protein
MYCVDLLLTLGLHKYISPFPTDELMETSDKYNTEMSVFWDVALCTRVVVGRHLVGAYYFHHQDDYHCHESRPDFSTDYGRLL